MLRISIPNRNEGQVDALLLNLSDILGKKQTNNPNFKNGITPYIWDDYGKADWYVYHQQPGLPAAHGGGFRLPGGISGADPDG